MPDYSKTIIYKLCCKDPSVTDIYVGHTTAFIKRKHEHKYGCTKETNKSYNLRVYKFIRDNGGWDNWDMIELCRTECIDSMDAKKKERTYLEELGATLNTEIPSRPAVERQKEYRAEHVEELKEYSQTYYQNNQDKCIKYSRTYYKNNKDKCIEYSKTYYKNNKDKCHEYYENNKEKIRIQSQERYARKKEKQILIKDTLDI
jgi:hypothetical protein